MKDKDSANDDSDVAMWVVQLCVSYATGSLKLQTCVVNVSCLFFFLSEKTKQKYELIL